MFLWISLEYLRILQLFGMKLCTINLLMLFLISHKYKGIYLLTSALHHPWFLPLFVTPSFASYFLRFLDIIFRDQIEIISLVQFPLNIHTWLSFWLQTVRYLVFNIWTVLQCSVRYTKIFGFIWTISALMDCSWPWSWLYSWYHTVIVLLSQGVAHITEMTLLLICSL